VIPPALSVFVSESGTVNARPWGTRRNGNGNSDAACGRDEVDGECCLWFVLSILVLPSVAQN